MKLIITHGFLILILLFSLLLINIEANPTVEEDKDDHQEVALDDSLGSSDNETESNSSFLNINDRSLRQKMRTHRGQLTCNKFPGICYTRGSPGPHCCKKKCVNVLTDKLNCGKCGKKCKYSEVCCKGKCVNPSFNRSHCGGCNNRCEAGGFCAFGLCNYA
ncbi:stigma-specific STIG1-like protein 1 [Argentina anserina]|uniref:stigma-specific STIG1-like protein 1 n=1 Tax=Argentina anserina TaxID=57926 RepID=UPI00217655B6|nr:stigma-specific STIG1-like protein 1 [Potentilla anserina]